MSTIGKRLYVYEGLPSGGAKVLYLSNLKFLRGKYKKIILIHEKFKPKNFLHYLVFALFHKTHKIPLKIYRPIKSDVLLAYHSWVTKSPNIMRHFPGKIIYLCQEVLREYFDQKHIEQQELKDRFVNLLRLPIKYNDRKNIEESKARLTVVANSLYEARLIDSVYGVGSKVIYPGVRTKWYFDKSVKKKNQILCVGHINKYKNQMFLVDVVSKIEEKYRPTLLLVGNGYDENYLNELRSLATNKKVNVVIKLNITEKQLKVSYNESKIFVYSPHGEPFGIVIVEALSSGLPIVCAVDGGGYIEILTQKNGRLLDRNPYNWAENIKELLLDEDELARLREYNIAYSQKFSYVNMNKHLLRLIQSKSTPLSN